MKYLRQARIAKNVSQQETANYLGVTRQAYYNCETDNREPDFETLLKLAEYFGTTVDYLLRGPQKEFAVNESELDAELISRLVQLTPAEIEKVDAFVQGLLASR